MAARGAMGFAVRLVATSLLPVMLPIAGPLTAQTPPAAGLPSPTATDSLGVPAQGDAPSDALPVKVLLGLSYGVRSDDCVLCADPRDNRSFSGHLSLIRPLGHGIGVGLDASVWRRGRPGTPLPPDTAGVVQGTTLPNTLGNLSVSFSYEVARFFMRAGLGAAYGAQTLEVLPADATEPVLDKVSGFGVGYSAGAGVTLPLISVLSLAFYVNWNEGLYDMSSALGTIRRDARHRWVEMGIGLSAR